MSRVFLGHLLPYTLRRGLSLTLGVMGSLLQVTSLFQGSPATASQVQGCEAGPMLTCHSHGCCRAEVGSPHSSNKCFPHGAASPALIPEAFKSAQPSSPKLTCNCDVLSVHESSSRYIQTCMLPWSSPGSLQGPWLSLDF